MLVSTPLGQLVSDGVPTSIVQAVAGVLVTLVASWELYSKRNWFLSPCNNMKNKGNKDCEKCYDTAERGESKVEEARSGSNENEKKEEIIIATEVEVGLVDFKTQLDSELFDKVTTTVDTTNDGNNEESSRKDQAGATTPPTPKTTISSVYASLAINPNNKNISITESSPQPNNNTIPTTQEERLKIGINKATFITLLAGGKFIVSLENSLSSAPVPYVLIISLLFGLSFLRCQWVFGRLSCYTWSSFIILFLTSSSSHNLQ